MWSSVGETPCIRDILTIYVSSEIYEFAVYLAHLDAWNLFFAISSSCLVAGCVKMLLRFESFIKVVGQVLRTGNPFAKVGPTLIKRNWK